MGDDRVVVQQAEELAAGLRNPWLFAPEKPRFSALQNHAQSRLAASPRSASHSAVPSCEALSTAITS